MDNISLQVHRHRLEGIAGEMGLILQRTAFSPNIKERRDFSCAIVDPDGNLVSQASHIPVHLGAVPVIMENLLNGSDPMEEGEGLIVNDPYAGGTHLPDISFVMPWYRNGGVKGYVINRAHHTDIGGPRAGSMAVSQHIDEEGFRTGPRVVYRDGELDRTSLSDLLEKTREPEQRVTDLEAQVASARRGLERLDGWARSLAEEPDTVFGELINYTSRYSGRVFREMPEGTYEASDVMDGDGCGNDDITLRVTTEVEEDAIVVDFRGSDDQVTGNINCPRAVTYSATYFVFQCLLPEEVPVNQGVLEQVEILTRPGSILDAEHPAPVAGGNVETSMRVVDLLLKSLAEVVPDRIPAGGQGTMNNLSIGWESKNGTRTYYETIGGGAGGGPDHHGVGGRQVHMTNTLNTPIEEFERQFPLVVECLRMRDGSGGAGKHAGGDGLIKQWRALDDIDVSFLTERRRHAPYGLAGGDDGKPGINLKLDHDGETPLPPKTALSLSPGEGLRFETPGGGGWGSPE